MNATTIAGLIAAASVLTVILFKRYVYTPMVDRVTVWEYERGLKYHKGRIVKILDPGRYWIFKPNTFVGRMDMRPRLLEVQGQEVLTADSISLKVSIAGTFKVADPYMAVLQAQDYVKALHTVVQVAMRDIIGSRPIDELLEDRRSFDVQLMGLCEKKAEELGLKLLSVNVRDIMFPGDLKRVFAKVVEARKEGLAALERARGETAALRNLANGAKILENNPALLQLRMLQSLAQSSGNTLVLNWSSADNPVPLTTS